MTPFRLSLPRRSRRELTVPSSLLRIEVCPPSLRVAPDSTWRRMLFWLAAPAPQDAAPPVNRLPAVREDFVRCLAGLDQRHDDEAGALREQIARTRSLRELWHLRAEVYRVVALAHSQAEAERRVSALNRHFPTRAPRSGFAPLLP